jgi:hypothetical protein
MRSSRPSWTARRGAWATWNDPALPDRPGRRLTSPVDLSEGLFVCTANDLGGLSAPLRDRLEVIELAGYTQAEKIRMPASGEPRARSQYEVTVPNGK